MLKKHECKLRRARNGVGTLAMGKMRLKISHSMPLLSQVGTLDGRFNSFYEEEIRDELISFQELCIGSPGCSYICYFLIGSVMLTTLTKC